MLVELKSRLGKNLTPHTHLFYLPLFDQEGPIEIQFLFRLGESWLRSRNGYLPAWEHKTNMITHMKHYGPFLLDFPLFTLGPWAKLTPSSPRSTITYPSNDLNNFLLSQLTLPSVVWSLCLSAQFDQCIGKRTRQTHFLSHLLCHLTTAVTDLLSEVWMEVEGVDRGHYADRRVCHWIKL